MTRKSHETAPPISTEASWKRPSDGIYTLRSILDVFVGTDRARSNRRRTTGESPKSGFFTDPDARGSACGEAGVPVRCARCEVISTPPENQNAWWARQNSNL